MKRLILVLVSAGLIVSLASPLAAVSPELERLRDHFGAIEYGNVPPLQPGIVEISGKAYALSLYDPFTQKSFRTDKLCILGAKGDTAGFWISSKNPDRGGVWVQWGHEIWIFGADLTDLTYQMALIGRYMKTTEINGRFSILRFKAGTNSEYGAFRLKKSGYSVCRQFE